jgi:hypothetical protein
LQTDLTPTQANMLDGDVKLGSTELHWGSQLARSPAISE